MSETDITNLTATLPMIAAMIGGAFVMFFTVKKKVSEGLESHINRLGDQITEQHKSLTDTIESNRKEAKDDSTQLQTKMDSMRSEIREDIKDVSQRVTHLERSR